VQSTVRRLDDPWWPRKARQSGVNEASTAAGFPCHMDIRELRAAPIGPLFVPAVFHSAPAKV